MSEREVSRMAAEMERPMPSREKYWEEMDDARRIQVLRDALASACHALDRQGKLILQLVAHQHGVDGGVVTPILRAQNNESGGLFTHDGGIPYNIRLGRERT